jgi:hypothetical protein
VFIEAPHDALHVHWASVAVPAHKHGEFWEHRAQFERERALRRHARRRIEAPEVRLEHFKGDEGRQRAEQRRSLFAKSEHISRSSIVCGAREVREERTYVKWAELYDAKVLQVRQRLRGRCRNVGHDAFDDTADGEST